MLINNNRHRVPSLKGSYFFWKSSFASAQINQVAASLAFATVLAIVPMLSIATILIGQLPQFVNFREGIQAWISVTLIPGGLSQSVSTYLDEFSTHSKGLTLFGVVGLIFSAFLTLMTIEKSFNQVWQVKRQRPYLIFHQAYDRNAQSALRWGNLKLVKTWKTGKLELFDLSKDLSEANDLSAKMPEKTKELDQTLTAFLTQVKATTVQTKIGKDE